MLFMSSGQNRALERMMTEVPNFKPRRRGVIIIGELHQQNACPLCDTCRGWENGRCLFDLCINMTKRIFDQDVTFTELILFTHICISDSDFRTRLKEYIEERGTKPMTFLTANHQKQFTEVTKHKECGSAAYSILPRYLVLALRSFYLRRRYQPVNVFWQIRKKSIL